MAEADFCPLCKDVYVDHCPAMALAALNAALEQTLETLAPGYKQKVFRTGFALGGVCERYHRRDPYIRQ